MKFFSGLFKFFAVLLMIVLVLVLPLALFAQSLGSLVLSPGEMVDILDEHLIDEEVLAGIAMYAFEEADDSRKDNDTLDEDPYGRIIIDGLHELDEGDWEDLIDLMAPSDLITDTMDDLLDDYYRWVRGSSEIPRIKVDLEPWKSNLKTNLIPAIELVMSTLPECSPEQQDEFMSLGELAEDASSCRPGEPIYGRFIQQADTTIPALIDDLPDDYNLKDDLEEQDDIDWKQVRRYISTFSFVTQYSWIVVLALFVVAIPMGARSLAGVFNWAGWPALFAGLLTVVLGAFMILFARGMLPGLNPVDNAIRSVPKEVSRPVEEMIADGMRFVARPILIEGGALVLAGGLLIIIAVVISSVIKRRQARVQELPVEPVSEAPPVEIIPEESEEFGEDTLEFTEDELDDSENDEGPSGMYG